MALLWGGVAAGRAEAAPPQAEVREEAPSAVRAPVAPPLQVQAWVGAPMVRAEDALLVVEVWATWCSACHATFPMLSRIQEEYGARVAVVALTDEPLARVRRFVDARRREMRFSVAVSDEQTVQRWMFGGFGGRGLPSVYLVRGERVVWGGAPDGLEAALRAELGSGR